MKATSSGMNLDRSSDKLPDNEECPEEGEQKNHVYMIFVMRNVVFRAYVYLYT